MPSAAIIAGGVSLAGNAALGIFYAQTGSNITGILQGISGAIGGGALLAMAKLWVDYRTNADKQAREIAAIRTEAEVQLKERDRKIEELQKEIDAGSEERGKMKEQHAIERDLWIIQVQDLRLGEAWNQLQLRIATGKEIPPKPPLFTPEAEKALNQSGIHWAPGDIPKGRDVLIIDDSPDTVLKMKKLLRYYGWVVRSAAGVAQALHMIQERKPDIILTDLIMPGMSGVDLIKSVQAKGDLQTRVIVLTAYPESSKTTEVRALGVEVLEKPIQFQRLLDLITPLDEIKDPSDY